MAVRVSQTFLISMTLTAFRITCQVLCRMSYGDLSDVFLMISLRLKGDGRKFTKVKCHSHQIISKVYTSNMTHYHCCWVWLPLAEVVLIWFHFKAILFFLFSVLCCLEGSHYFQPTLKEWRVMFPLIEQSFYIIYLEWSCMGDLSTVSDLFTYSMLHLYQYKLTWVIVQYWCIYFAAQVVLALAIECSFSWLLGPFHIF